MNIVDAMNKSLFFFGAGASYDSGCKMSNQMLDDLQSIIVQDKNDLFNKTEKEAIKFLLACLEYHCKWRSLDTLNNFKFAPNIEELALLIRRIKNRENFLPYPITGNWADKLISLETEFKSISNGDNNLFSSLDTKLKNTMLPLWLTHQNTNFLEPLKNLFEGFPDENLRMNIFTLNNDRVIEEYFTNHNMPPWSGFVSNVWKGVEFDNIPADYGRICLYKLHGSLDWIRLVTGEVKIKDQLSDEEKEYIDEKHDPYVIFGHGTKTFSVEPFFSLIHDFKMQLKNKKYIFIIGYSFFDTYINNLLFESVNYNQNKLIIINPTFGPKVIENLFSDKAGDFFEALDKSGKNANKILIDYLEEIQKNPFYSEIPEFNITKINGENPIHYMKIGTKEFLDNYFKDKGYLFVEFIEQLEKERLELEEPFC